MDNLNLLIGNNLNRIRVERRLSLDQVAELTGVSKSMLAQMEKGKKTPTVTTLWKIANGLNVSFSVLMKDKKPQMHFVSSQEIKPIVGNNDHYRVFPFFPFDEDTKFEIFKMEFEPQCIYKSEAHASGVKEYVLVCSGSLEIELDETTYKVKNGEALLFSGDICHIYKNTGNELISAYVLIFYANK